jgi:hypothetical protein
VKQRRPGWPSVASIRLTSASPLVLRAPPLAGSTQYGASVLWVTPCALAQKKPTQTVIGCWNWLTGIGPLKAVSWNERRPIRPSPA